jgi:uncharacterized protein
MTPLLLLLFGVAPMAAVGTDLWFAAITKAFAAPIHHKHRLIDWQVVKRLWAGSLPASTLTLLWLRSHRLDDAHMDHVKGAIAIAVMVTAVAMLFQKRLHGAGRRLRITEGQAFKKAQGPLTIAAGALLGLLVTATSVGAGALGAVMLVYLYPLRLTPPRLIATDIVHALPLALFAGIGHLVLGHVDGLLLGSLLIGSIPAVMFGAALSARLPHSVLRWALIAVLLAVGVKLWFSIAGGPA